MSTGITPWRQMDGGWGGEQRPQVHASTAAEAAVEHRTVRADAGVRQTRLAAARAMRVSGWCGAPARWLRITGALERPDDTGRGTATGHWR